MGDADVREIFASCGRITKVNLDRPGYSQGGPKGATLFFDAKASAELAVKQMDGVKLRGDTLHVALEGGGGQHRAKPY